MLTPTNEPPRAISAAEHADLTSRTPSDFADIPPIQHWVGDAEVVLTSGTWKHWPISAETQANGHDGTIGTADVDADANDDEIEPMPVRAKGRLHVTTE
jgi:hypothetical protein